MTSDVAPALHIPSFLEKTVEFPDGRSYELIRSLTDYRKCHDGRPLEARIVFLCRRLSSVPDSSEAAEKDDEFVMKVKVQVPDLSDNEQTSQLEGPSTTTAHELEALDIFTKSDTNVAPHMVAFKKEVQNSSTSPLPGGYLTFTVMTKMPGTNLLDAKYWNMTAETRAEITKTFLDGLRTLYTIGIEPVDCGLRNVIWDDATKRCTIIDFELWREPTAPLSDTNKELERWGLAKRKPAISWWAEWKHQGF